MKGEALSRRLLIGLLVMATGSSALVFQTVWQRYLSFLVGSEARSVSLVVGVFLLGLATGYRFWGGRTRVAGRRRSALVRAYGLVEIGIGLYGAVFPFWFMGVRKLAYAAPDWFLLDALFTALLVFAPTFLMGATIPLLTAALPGQASEINTRHARIYGLNTLGAVAGCWLGAFILIPRLGLRGALVAAALADVAAGLGFVWLSRGFTGVVSCEGELEQPSEPLSEPGVYALGFVSGAVTIALEVWLVRLTGLTIGSTNTVFALVLGVFVFGLALGSLTLPRRLPSGRRAARELASAAVAVAVLYFLVPYWPNWFAALRLWVGEGAVAFNLYLICAALLFAVLWLPALVPLGRLLPLAYALAPKNRENYGEVCGRLYFVNTLGTVAGAWVLGQGLLFFANIDQSFKVVVGLLAASAVVILAGQKRLRLAGIVGAAFIAFVFSPHWNRASYHVGMFRSNQLSGYKFGGIFEIPGRIHEANVEFLEDGPDATVTVTRFYREPSMGHPGRVSRSIVVNGKSDGNTVGDFPTMALVATLPYLALEKDKGIDAAVIGLGTGISAGLLARMQDVRDVTVVEISRSVIRAAPVFDFDNHAFRHHEKASIVNSDAFRFFARAARQYDLVIAEPSNPWVTGVENLFTPEFYELVKSRLAPGGAYVQWFHLYEMSEAVIASVFGNVADSFENAGVYLVGSSDLAIIAARRPLTAPHLERRFDEAYVRDAHARAGVTEREDLRLLHLFGRPYMRWFAEHVGVARRHDLEHPWLSDHANVARFYGTTVYLDELMRSNIARAFFEAPGKGEAIARLLAKTPKLRPPCFDKQVMLGPLCQRFQYAAALAAKMREEPTHEDWNRLWGYSELRRQGLTPPDGKFLRGVRDYLLSRSKLARDAEMRRETAIRLVREYEFDGDQQGARETERALRLARVIAQ